jgi:DNA-binding NarL/FixJ family response regulator
MAIHLLIVDDHAFVREALRMTLSDTEIDIVAEAGDGQEGFEAAQQHRVDVALVDVQMPRADGFQFLRLVRDAGLKLRVVMHSSWNRSEFVSASRDLGACGFVVKGDDTDALINAIRAAALGGEWGDGTSNWPAPSDGAPSDRDVGTADDSRG